MCYTKNSLQMQDYLNVPVNLRPLLFERQQKSYQNYICMASLIYFFMVMSNKNMVCKEKCKLVIKTE